MTYFFADQTLQALRKIAVNESKSVPERIAAMKLVREFETEFRITFGRDKTIE